LRKWPPVNRSVGGMPGGLLVDSPNLVFDRHHRRALGVHSPAILDSVCRRATGTVEVVTNRPSKRAAHQNVPRVHWMIGRRPDEHRAAKADGLDTAFVGWSRDRRIPGCHSNCLSLGNGTLLSKPSAGWVLALRVNCGYVKWSCSNGLEFERHQADTRSDQLKDCSQSAIVRFVRTSKSRRSI
jgi:hypothetical protein